VANRLLNLADTSKPRCTDKLNISFVTVTCFGSDCHRKEYESHEVFCAAHQKSFFCVFQSVRLACMK
jgi:hypothetical protein